DRRRRVAGSAVVLDAAAKKSGRVAAEGAAAHPQRRAADVETIVVDPAALVGRVAADGAVAHCERRMVVVDAAAAGCGRRVAVDKAVGDGQAREGDRDSVTNVKHTAGGVTVHSEIAGAGAEDVDTVRN